MDLTGFGMSKWTKRNIGLTKRFLGLVQETYPELMGKVFICNAPLIFTSIFSIIKGWLDEKTRQKIQIHSGDPLPELLKFMDIEQIPDFLGG